MRKPKKVKATYKGKVSIWVQPNYYYGTINIPNPGYMVDEDGGIIIFESYKEADNRIHNLCSQTYYLSHGEAGRPDYLIVRVPNKK